MNVLLLLAKGFETMEMSVFVDVLGWARNDYGRDADRQKSHGLSDLTAT